MINFSGIWFRIFGSSGIIMIIGIICTLIEKKKMKIGYIIVALSLCLMIMYGFRIIMPSISLHTGHFVEVRRDSRIAPPLPVTYKYTFDDGSGLKKGFYLDTFSKNAIYPDDLVIGSKYTVYYDSLLHIIVRIDNEALSNDQ